jgi:hypothetical protein
MSSGAGDTTQLVPGYPIRTPWDHSSVDSSPRPIAASHVLHRLLVPRHPPSALDNLTTKMLASTVQFSTNDQPTTPPPPPAPTTKPTTGMNHHRDEPPRDPTAERYEGQAMPGPTRNNKPHARPPPGHDACSLRTQQGAHHQPPAAPTAVPPPTTPTRGPHARTRPDRPLPAADSPVSPPTSTPGRHNPTRRLPPALRREAPLVRKCSLERR